MRHSIIALAITLSLTVSSFAGGPADELAKKIYENGHKRVGVIPSVIYRNEGQEHSSGKLGPLALNYAKEVYEQLVDASGQEPYKGNFRVVPERTMRYALNTTGFTVDDLGNPVKIRGLAEAAGVDTLVTLGKDEQADELRADLLNAKDGEEPDKKEEVSSTRVGFDRIEAEILDADDGFVTYTQEFQEDRTLSKAAYTGESWELRRWENGELVNVGFDLEERAPFGKGTKWERYQYSKMKDDLRHPFDVAGFPFIFEIFVNGKKREPEKFDTEDGPKYVVAMDEGDLYSIRLRNDSDKPVYVGFYIDGLTSIDKELREPANVETRRHWHWHANGTVGEIAGWYEIERDDRGKPRQPQYYNEFKIVPKEKEEESVALGKGFEENLGMITAIFYTVGMDGVDQPSDKDLPIAMRGMPSADFGTGMGDRKKEDLEHVKGKHRGLMLAALTVYYRTTEEIEKLRAGTSDDPVLPKKEDGNSKKDKPVQPDDGGEKKPKKKSQGKAEHVLPE